MYRFGKYELRVIKREVDGEVFFSIRAICRNSLKYSSINNLNTILSLLDVQLEDRQYEDSTWIIPRHKADTFSQIIHQAFNEGSFLAFLEKQLDDDRLEGEWENQIHLNH